MDINEINVNDIVILDSPGAAKDGFQAVVVDVVRDRGRVKIRFDDGTTSVRNPNKLKMEQKVAVKVGGRPPQPIRLNGDAWRDFRADIVQPAVAAAPIQKEEEFMIWVENGRNPEKVHKNYEEAVEEAKRLAAKNAGREFFVVRRMSKHSVEMVAQENNVIL